MRVIAYPCSSFSLLAAEFLLTKENLTKEGLMQEGYVKMN